MNLPVHQLAMTALMSPDTANFSGKGYGGSILKILDQAAYPCARRYAERYMVTLSGDQVIFRQPIQVGELVTLLASINQTCNTFMEVGIKVMAENIRSKVARHVNSCFFTMIAVDDDGKPVAVPHLTPVSADERCRFAAAELRRSMQREMEHKFAVVSCVQ